MQTMKQNSATRKRTPDPEWVERIVSSLPSLLTLGEVAQILRCSLRSITRHVSGGRLFTVNIGARVLIPKSSLVKLLTGEWV